MSARTNQSHGFEWWMVSNIAAGAATGSFLTLLIPPFITSVTGSAARSGVVLAFVGLAALIGPQIGRFADRKRLHRPLYILSIAGMSLGFMLLVLDAKAALYSPIIGLILGVCLAAQGTIGPAFIVGAKQSQATVAKQLTVYSLLFPVGQVIGALVVLGGHVLHFGIDEQFFSAGLALALCAVMTWLSSNKPAQRLQQAQHELSHRPAASHVQPQRKALLFSTFGIFMVAATLGAIANNGMSSQIANILPAVYGFSAIQTAAVIGLAGLLSIGVLIVGGKVMRAKGAFTVYGSGSWIRFLGIGGMAILGALGGTHLLLAGFMTLIAFQGPQLTRMVAPRIAEAMAPVQAAEANGYYFATSALGAFLGSLAAGFIADKISFSAINWMNALLAGLAALIVGYILRPRAQRFSKLFRHSKV